MTKGEKGRFTVKRLRTLSILLLAMLMLLLPVQASAAAAQANTQRIMTIERWNDRFDARSAIKRHGLEIVSEANTRIEEIIAQSCRLAERARCDAELEGIIISMQIRTSVVSRTARAAAAMCGVKAVCEYVDVTIGNRVVQVDPLRVVRV